MRGKSTTDLHWNERAVTESDPAKVNIEDTVQRDLELKFIQKHLHVGERALEVGCGNGFVTNQIREQVAFVDAFDYAENMIDRARERYGESNNRFFQDDVLDPRNIEGSYDAVICVRVLINLRDLGEQCIALENIARALRTGGRLILVEGYMDGFEALNGLREDSGLPAAQPAAINYYSHLSDITPVLNQHFVVADTFHTGLFDILTRVVYPALVGPDQATEPGEFHQKIEPIVRTFSDRDLARFARLHGFLLIKR